MSEQDLELLITLDDPVDPQEEDIFNHLHAENTVEYWLDSQFAAREKNEKTSKWRAS